MHESECMPGGHTVSGFKRSLSRLFVREKGPAAPPALRHPVRFPFGQFEVQIHAGPGQECEVEATRDFKSWELVETISTAKEITAWSDSKAEKHAALFYRVRSGEFVSNYVGFLKIEIPPGYSMISNPLHCASNAVADLLPGMPDQTILTRLNQVTFQLSENQFRQKKWSMPADKLVPGDGALIYNPAQTSLTATFVGEVATQAIRVPIHQGTTLRSSMLPLAGRLDTDLGFPISSGDVVSVYSNHNERYLDYTYKEGGWSGEAPHIRLGEAFWIAKNVAGSWSQKLPEAENP